MTARSFYNISKSGVSAIEPVDRYKLQVLLAAFVIYRIVYKTGLQSNRAYTYLQGRLPMKNTTYTMPAESDLYDLSELFKVFGDNTRIKLLFVLHAGELCVSDISEKLDMTQSAVSHQLKILKQAKLIKSRRDGKQIFYSLSDDHVHSIITLGLEHVQE